MYSNQINIFIKEVLNRIQKNKNELEFYTKIVTELKNKNKPFSEKELFEIFDALDIEEVNVIKFSKVLDFLCVLRNDINSFFVDKIIEEFMKEKSEEITRDVFVIKMKFGITTRDSEDTPEIEEIFNWMDKDKSGTINVNDILLVMNSWGETMFDKKVSKAFINLITQIPKKTKDKTGDNSDKEEEEPKYNVNNMHEEGITKEQFMEIFKNEN